MPDLRANHHKRRARITGLRWGCPTVDRLLSRMAGRLWAAGASASVGLLIKFDMCILTLKLFLNRDVLTSL
jgi:hypothetical protein